MSLDPPLPSQVLLDLYTPTLTGAALLDLPLPSQVLLDLPLPPELLAGLVQFRVRVRVRVRVMGRVSSSIGRPHGDGPHVHTALSTESGPSHIRPPPAHTSKPSPGRRRRAGWHLPGLAHESRGSTAHQPTAPVPSSVPVEGTDGWHP